MKIFKIIKSIFLYLSFVLAGVTFVLGSITLNATDAAISATCINFVLLGFVGFFMFNAKNSIVKRIGVGLTTGFMVVILYASIAAIAYSAAAILGVAAVSVYALYFILLLIEYIAYNKSVENDPQKNPKIQKIIEWKKLLDEGIISKEEFEKQRQAILNLDSSKK